MAMQNEELRRVVGEQAEMYERMIRSIWGDRIALAMTATAMGGFGMGLLYCDKWRTRMLGAVFYATAAGMQLYAAMSPKTREQRAAAEPSQPEARAA